MTLLYYIVEAIFLPPVFLSIVATIIQTTLVKIPLAARWIFLENKMLPSLLFGWSQFYSSENITNFLKPCHVMICLRRFNDQIIILERIYNLCKRLNIFNNNLKLIVIVQRINCWKEKKSGIREKSQRGTSTIFMTSHFSNPSLLDQLTYTIRISEKEKGEK